MQGQLEQACAYGREAIDLTGSLDSARATTYVRRLLAELAPHVQEEQVRGLRSYTEGNLASSAAACSTPMMVAAPKDLTALDHVLCLRDRHPAHRLGFIDLWISNQTCAAGHVDVLRCVR